MAKFEYDKKEWIKQQNEKLANMHKGIKELAENYKRNPDTIAELLEFQSRFYQYSIKNGMLIRGQNPYSTYVASYKDWLNKGCRVRKGEKGLAIFVPCISQVFTPINGNEHKKLSQATDEEKELIAKNKIKVYTLTKFSIGHVFDIAQTDCPPEKYPEFYSMGYSSKQHDYLYSKIKEYANSVGVTVNEKDLKSIALRGCYSPVFNEISISDKLNDTEKLSTLTHELGHALMHGVDKNISVSQGEYEADCVSIMLQSHLGIELTQSRKAHLAQHYQKLDKDFNFDESLNRVNKVYTSIIPEIDKLINIKQSEKEKNRILSSKPKYSKEQNNEIIESLKQNIDIIELARDLGYTPVKEGSLYTLKEHDSIKLYPNTNSFTRFSKEQSNGKHVGGSVIDLVIELTGATVKDSIEYLKTKINVPEFAYSNNTIRSNPQASSKQDEITPFILPKKNSRYNRAFAYLAKTRKIEPSIIFELMEKEHIYEDERHNVVFCGKDENDKIVFATKKSTLTDSKYRGDVSGSNQEIGIFVNNNANTLVVNEAFIDSMSYMSLMALKGKDYHKQNYLALNGVSGKPVIHHLESNKNIDKVIFALDSDVPGKQATARIKTMVEDFAKDNNRNINIEFCIPHQKDFNEDLKEVRKIQEQRLCPINSKEQQYELER